MQPSTERKWSSNQSEVDNAALLVNLLTLQCWSSVAGVNDEMW